MSCLCGWEKEFKTVFSKPRSVGMTVPRVRTGKDEGAFSANGLSNLSTKMMEGSFV